MEKQTGKQLLRKLKDGTISAGEIQLLERWYEDYTSKAAPFDNARAYLRDMEILDKAFPFEKEHSRSKTAVYKLWPQLVAAVASVALIVTGLYFFNTKKQTTGNGGRLIAQDVAPGKIGATLKLANGKAISLSDAVNGEIAKEEGFTVTKTAEGYVIYNMKATEIPNGKEGSSNSLTTAKGETYVLILPDQSKVWLNAASSLTYSPSLLKNGLRTVRLNGEAYFEIFEDKKHPFIVETSKQQIEVLGTHFNVNAYTDEPVTTTTLLKGSVRLVAGNNVRILKPGQQGQTSRTEINLSEADLEGVTDWKDGDFSLDNLELRTVMRKIARWYNVDVVYSDDVSDDIRSVGIISRDKQLSSILGIIEASGQVKFKIEGRKVYVSQ